MHLRAFVLATVSVLTAATLLRTAAPAGAAALDAPPDTTKPDTIVIGEPRSEFPWTTRTADFRQDIPISAGRRGDTVRAEAPAMRGPNGETVPVRAWFGDDSTVMKVTLESLGTTVLHVAAHLPAPGEYRGQFSLRTTGRRTDKGYTVTLAKAPAPVIVVHGSDASSSTLGPLAVLGIADRVVVPLTLVDSVAPASVSLPQLETLQRYAGGDTAIAVDFGAVKLLAQDGTPITDSVIALKQGDSRRVRLHVSGIRAAGAYTGTVRILAEGAEPRLAGVKIYVRRSGWVALILIALGSAISAVIREYQMGLRPRLLRQRRAAELLEWVAATERQLASTGGTNEAEKGVLDAQRVTLERIYAGQKAPPAQGGGGDAATAADDDTLLKLIASRLEVVPDWVNARRQVDAIPAEEPDDGAAAGFRESLATIGEALRTGTADQVKSVGESARNLPNQIRDRLKERLLARITGFGERVKAEREAHAASDALLAALAVEVQQKLARATRLAGDGRLEEAGADYDGARVAYADVLARDLRLRIGQAHPGWMAEAKWTQLTKEVEAALGLLGAARTPDARLTAFEGAQSLYLRTLADELKASARAVRDERPGLPDDQKTAIDSVVAKAESTRARLSIGNLNGAADDYAAAEAAFRELLPRLSAPAPRGVQIDGANVAPPPPSAALGDVTAISIVPGWAGGGRARMIDAAPIRRATAAELTAAVRRWDRALNIAVAVITAVLGMWLLWVGRLIWGSPGDMIAAFLWGLGLHQAGTRGSTGILQSIVGSQREGGA